MRPFPIAIFFSFTLFSTACATTTHVPASKSDPAQSDSETVPGVSDAASFCGALCDRENQCDTSLDGQTCKNSCTNSTAAVFPRLRSDVVQLIVTCFDDKDCKSVLGGDVVGTCASEAVARVAPSDAAVAYCDALTSAKQKCGGATSKATCLDTAKLYSDDAIAEAQNCAARACTEIDACVGAVFGAFGTTTKTSSSSGSSGSSSNSCAGDFPELQSCESCAESSCCTSLTACQNDSGCRSILSACANGVSTSSCSSAYSYQSTTSQQHAGAVLSCLQSSCSSSCSVP